MLRYWRWVVSLLLVGLWGWVATVPLYAHHTVDGELSNTLTDEHHLSVAQVSVTLPPNFIARRVVSGLRLPTDMVILPSGDMLITEKGMGTGVFSIANMRLVREGILQPTPVLALGVNSEEDSGLLGIVLDPQFATNNFFYLWYSTGESALGWAGTSYNRLSRFTFDAATGRADPSSETVILDEVPWSPIHNGGGLAFDAAGNLLIATGDAGSDFAVPATNLAQSLLSLNGKVLRIRPLPAGGYVVPDDNPYVNIAGALPEIYASGLRNPFRIARRAADQSIYVIDVGQSTWEEVNKLAAGANYGWPYREGKCVIYKRENCSATPPQFVDPVVSYLHPEEIGAGLTALAFYEGNLWPAPYQGQLFVADFNSDWLGVTDVTVANPTIRPFATAVGSLVDMEATNEGLYTLSIAEGTVRFIYFDMESNQPPVAELSTSAVNGPAPLQVTFVATATDANNDDFVFVWDFGDGSQLTTTQARVSHSYAQDGDYLATLQVVDENDGKSEILSQLVQVYSGALPTIVQENLIDSDRTLYRGEDEFRFSVAREGGFAELDPIAPYAWTILLHHNEHVHYLLADFVSNDVTLKIPLRSHALNSPLWYEMRLAMQTATGQVIQRTMNLLPQTTTIQVQSWPGPSIITIDQQVQEPDELTLVIVGQEYTLEARERMIHNGKVGRFKHWVVTSSWPQGNAGDDEEIVTDRLYTFVVPDEANAYVAFYEYIGQATPNYLPGIGR